MSSSSPAVIPLTRPIAPRRFGQYILIRKLAEGGMAEIYLAKQVGAEGFERDVVIKCMLDHFSRSPEFVAMFLDEARLAARLHHPNIVQITDLGVADGRYFICMEYLAGEDVEALVDTQHEKGVAIPIPIAARIMLSALEGLEFAHGYQEHGKLAGLVHRDISPSNIFVTYQGTVKVLDFGIAKASTRMTQTQPGLLKGKWGYMSPEQARGEAQLDGRSDVFSLGITFHELLTSRRVFERHHEIGVLLALMDQPIPAPSAVRADVPPALDRIVMKALERRLEDRYSSAWAMRADLEDFLRSTSSVPGVSQLAEYMQHLFGSSQMEHKTKIPPLAALTGLESLPRDTVTGLEKTVIRPSGTVEAVPVAAPPPVARVPPPAPVAAPPVRAGLSIALGALVAVGLLGLGGGVAWYLMPRPSAGVSPPPVANAQPVVEPPPAAIEPTEPVAPPTPPSPPPEPVQAVQTPPPPPTPAEPVRTPAIRLTPKRVNEVLAKQRKRLEECAMTFRTELPANGLVKAQLHIKNSGDVRKATVSEPAAATLPKLAQCLEGRLERVKFPRNNNEPELLIELPLRFNTTGP